MQIGYLLVQTRAHLCVCFSQVSFTVLLSRYLGAFTQLEDEEGLNEQESHGGGSQVATRNRFRAPVQ